MLNKIFSKNWFYLILYIIITIFFTRSLIYSINTHIVGGGDVWAYLWTIWCMKKSIIELNKTPLFTDYLYYPVGTTLYFHFISYINSLPEFFCKLFLTL